MRKNEVFLFINFFFKLWNLRPYQFRCTWRCRACATHLKGVYIGGEVHCSLWFLCCHQQCSVCLLIPILNSSAPVGQRVPLMREWARVEALIQQCNILNFSPFSTPKAKEVWWFSVVLNLQVQNCCGYKHEELGLCRDFEYSKREFDAPTDEDRPLWFDTSDLHWAMLQLHQASAAQLVALLQLSASRPKCEAAPALARCHTAVSPPRFNCF